MGRSFKAIVLLVIAAYIGYVLNFVCVGDNASKEVHLTTYLEQATNAFVRPYFTEVYDLMHRERNYGLYCIDSGRQVWSRLDKAFGIEAKALRLHASVRGQICLVKYYALSLIDRVLEEGANLWIEKGHLLIPITWQIKLREVLGGLYESSSELAKRVSEEVNLRMGKTDLSLDMLSKAWAYVIEKTEVVLTVLVDRVYFYVNLFLDFFQNHILPAGEKDNSLDKAIEHERASYGHLDHHTETSFSEEKNLEDGAEPSTVLITSTVLATLNEPHTETYLTEGSIPRTVARDLEEEVKYWESRVHDTLTAAERSLEKEFSARLNSRLPLLQEGLTQKLEDVRNKNYNLYRRMNAMIKEIEKDASQMLELGKIIDSETVSGRPFYTRQDMREGIKNSSTMTDDSVEVIKKLLDENHDLILKDYFSDLQGTIDVLESFADLTMQEFTRRLHLLISQFEGQRSADKIIQWSVWKDVHRTKESIFDFRDRLVNEAHAYQKGTPKAPLAVAKWDSLLKSINHEVNTLLQDNAEYLYFLRARANIAYQSRESESSKLQRKDNEGQEEKAYEGEEEVIPGEEARPKEEAYPGEQVQPRNEAQPGEEANPGQESGPGVEAQPRE